RRGGYPACRAGADAAISRSPLLLALLLAAAALVDAERELVVLDLLAVLTLEVEDRPLRFLAEVFRVLDQALLATLHVEDELRHRHVRHFREHRLQPTVLGADHPVELDVHLA